ISRIGLSFNLPPQAIPSLVIKNITGAQYPIGEDFIVQQNIEELEAKTNENPIVFGIALSSLLSSSPETSSPQPGVGCCFTTEIPFNKKIALYTRVHLSNQTLTSEVNENPSVLTGTKALQSVTTDLLSLDIPVYIWYDFSDWKDNSMYVEEGVSTLDILGVITDYEYVEHNTLSHNHTVYCIEMDRYCHICSSRYIHSGIP